MKRNSTIRRNWPRYALQWGVLAALVLFLTGLIHGDEPADPEAYCPVGGLQALATWLVNGTLPCSMTTLQIAMGIALAAAVILFSKLFCGYICPVGSALQAELHYNSAKFPKNCTVIVQIYYFCIKSSMYGKTL